MLHSNIACLGCARGVLPRVKGERGCLIASPIQLFAAGGTAAAIRHLCIAAAAAATPAPAARRVDRRSSLELPNPATNPTSRRPLLQLLSLNNGTSS